MSSADSLAAAYEQLRRHALSNGAAPKPTGLVLLQREGVAAWMLGRGNGPLAAEPLARPAPAALFVSDPLHRGLVDMLATMALAGAEGRRAHGN